MPDLRTEPRGPEITQADVEMHRQIHPSWREHDGRPNSLLFRPSPKDNGLLSLADGRLRSSEAAWRFHVQLGFSSSGTATLPVSVFQEQSLRVYADPLIAAMDGPEDAAHAVSDHRALGPGPARRIAKELRDRATVTYPAPS